GVVGSAGSAFFPDGKGVILRRTRTRRTVERAPAFHVRSNLDCGPVFIRECSNDVLDHGGFSDLAALPSHDEQKTGKRGMDATRGHSVRAFEGVDSAIAAFASRLRTR